MTASEGFVETNSLSPPSAGRVRLHYLEWGSAGPAAAAPVCVLLHATGFLARLFEPIAEALSGRFHVYAYDARGHGDSDKPIEGYGWPAIADDLKGFADALGLTQILAIGHSSGAAGVAHLAATRPEYISKAVLIEPTIFPPMPEETAAVRRQALSSSAARRRMVWPSREALIRSYRQRPAFAGWRDDLLRLYAEHGTFRREDGQIELKCPGKIEAVLYERSLSPDTWRLLPDIHCPVLVLRGDSTEQMLAMVADGVAQRIEGARLTTIAGAGHLAPMERPDAVIAEIMDFLGEGAAPK
jgi:pimeloyl-ACP methyl ester carboxylesterase